MFCVLSIPRNTKFVDLPAHIKDALLGLEQQIKSVAHRAATPPHREAVPAGLSQPKDFLAGELDALQQVTFL